jgi:uncharacterized protein (DUF362 family)
MEHVGGLTRRGFVRAGAAGLAALAVARRATGDPAPGARVAQVRCERVLQDGSPQQAVATEMLEAAAQALAGMSFPAFLATLVTPDDVVGLKVNALAGLELSTNVEVALAVAGSLQAAGVPAERIVIWDRFQDHLERCLYPVNQDGPGVRCYGGEGGTGLDPDAAYPSDLGDGKPSLFYRVASREVTKIINLPVPKDHNCSGMTGCLKNLAFGSISSTVRFHGPPHYCDPMIAEVCAHPALAGKVVLHVVDAVRGLYDGGPTVSRPEAVFDQCELWLGSDPVALDSLIVDLLNGRREEAGLPPIGAEGPPPVHLETAERLGLGSPTQQPGEVARVELA